MKPNREDRAVRFVNIAKAKYGTRYEYEIASFHDSSTKMNITCSVHGAFQQAPGVHLSSKYGCHACAMINRGQNTRMSNELYIEKCMEKHSGKYDYSVTHYCGFKNKVDIICSIHGVFRQEPLSHLGGRGCKSCGIERRIALKRLGREEFIKRARAVHGDLFDYSLVEYKSNHITVKIRCDKHGVFNMAPDLHTGNQKQGCPKCGKERSAEWRTYSTEEFINLSKATHGLKYDYSISHYIGCMDRIDIICPKHGVFKQRPVNHIEGKGCQKCALDSRHRFKRDRFVKNRTGQVTLYLVEMYDQNERFLKLGLTSTTISDRFSSLPYEFREIQSISSSAPMIWDLEVMLHKLCSSYVYKPIVHFKGHTECYNISALDDVKRLWQESTTSLADIYGVEDDTGHTPAVPKQVGFGALLFSQVAKQAD